MSKKPNTTFIEREDFRKNIRNNVDKIKTTYQNIDLILNENLYPMDKSSYHFIGQMLKKFDKQNRSEYVFASQIFNAVYRSEIMSAGAGEIAFLYALELTKLLLQNTHLLSSEQTLQQEFDTFIKKYKNAILENSKISSIEDIENVINKCCENRNLSKTVFEAVMLAGLEGKIFVENGRQENYVVEIKEGYNFNLQPYKWMLYKGPWERRECKVVIIDGLLEKVSEINHLLQHAFDTKQSMVIFALGFSEEVGMTLRTNYDRGLLDVQPVRIPTDLESLNMVNDLSSVCGTLPISSMKGDMIIFTKWEDLPTIEKIKITETQTVIENSKTRATVSAQIKSLLEKRNENHLYEDIQNLLDKRIKSLVSNAVNIYLPNITASEIDTQRIQIDVALRQCKTILNYGLSNFIDVAGNMKPDTELEKIFIAALKATTLRKDIVPTLSVVMGCMLAGKSAIMLCAASGAVEVME